MVIKTWRDPYNSGFSPTRPKEIELQEGVTVLVGCNGAGKTTLINNIESKLKLENIPCHKFNNLSEGGFNSISSILSGSNEFEGDNMELGVFLFNASEGESIKANLNRQSTLYEEFLKTGYFKNRKYHFKKIFEEDSQIQTKERALLYDATDSGLSIDSIIELKNMFLGLLTKAKEIGLHLYIIIAANEYELCRNENCFDVNEGKYISFASYEDYRNFIIKSRQKKEKRIEKQKIWFEKREKKIKEQYEKLEQKINPRIEEIKQKAKNENRDLSWMEKSRIQDFERKLEDFKREHSF